MPTSPSPRSERLGTPNPPAIRFTRDKSFGASRFTHLLRPAKLLALLYGSDRCTRPPRAFTSRLSTARSPSPLLDMTTTATGLLCWQDSHPAGMAASLAAPEPYVRLSRIRLVWDFLCQGCITPFGWLSKPPLAPASPANDRARRRREARPMLHRTGRL